MSKRSLPYLALRVLYWFCPNHLYEEIEGDLIQKFNRDVKTFGERKARRRLVWNAVRFFRLEIIARNKFESGKISNLMLVNYMKFTFRQAAKNKAFSLINIFGLITGITVCLFVAQFVWFEWSFERYNKNIDRIYRVNLYNTSNGVFDEISSGTVSGLGYAMQQSVPGIESLVRFSHTTTGIVRNDDRKVENLESNIVYADPSIIKVLQIELIEGVQSKVLRSTHTAMIAESVALKYFGDVKAVGQTLEMGFVDGSAQTKPYQIEGVFRDMPANSKFRFDFILPPENQQEWDENWAWSNVFTYAMLPPNVKPEDLDIGLSKIVKRYHEDGTGDRYLLEPLTQIRLQALDGSGRATLINFFVLLGVIILLLAWFNYINLSTARFFERMKEVGMRKLIGASRTQLIIQLLTESLLMNFISFCVALLLFFLCWPTLTQLIQQPIPTSLFYEPWAFFWLICFIVIGTLCTGFYPALFLSAFKPLQSLKGTITKFADRSMLRKALVIVQLSASVVLITGMVAIQRQVDYMRNQNLGISIDQTLIIKAPLMTDVATAQKFEPFANEVLQLPSVKGVTYASSFPGSEIDWHRTDITLEQENADYLYDSRIISIGNEFLDVFDIPLLAGRNFKEQSEQDNKGMLINERASKMFGFTSYHEALNKLIFIGNRKFEVIGVVKDYHFRSFQYQLQPMLYIEGYPRNPGYAIKIGTENIAETIAKIESRWKEAYHGNVFSYTFLDDSFEKEYENEKQLGAIVGGITLLALLISCSGLFGLSIYAVNQRTKEIGIRKVLGATVLSIVVLLSRKFAKLMIVGGLIAIPLVYVGVNYWLEGYAYKMPVDGWLFVVPLLIVTLLVWFTISFKAISAAKRNPVESMKYE